MLTNGIKTKSDTMGIDDSYILPNDQHIEFAGRSRTHPLNHSFIEHRYSRPNSRNSNLPDPWAWSLNCWCRRSFSLPSDPAVVHFNRAHLNASNSNSYYFCWRMAERNEVWSAAVDHHFWSGSPFIEGWDVCRLYYALLYCYILSSTGLALLAIY